MSYDPTFCTPTCWARVKCQTCNRTKAPRGRDVPAAYNGGYCTFECIDYYNDPAPGHLWPEENPNRKEPIKGTIIP